MQDEIITWVFSEVSVCMCIVFTEKVKLKALLHLID